MKDVDIFKIALVTFMHLKVHENYISISNCKGQSYDNASNMSGKYDRV